MGNSTGRQQGYGGVGGLPGYGGGYYPGYGGGYPGLDYYGGSYGPGYSYTSTTFPVLPNAGLGAYPGAGLFNNFGPRIRAIFVPQAPVAPALA